MKCQFLGCAENALPEAVTKGTVNGIEIDLFLCQRHVDAITRGVTCHLSIKVEATPATPEIPQHPRIEWDDVQEGDTVSLLVSERYAGHPDLVREQRKVIEINGPKITLAEGGRVYTIDTRIPDPITRRDLRLVDRAVESRESRSCVNLGLGEFNG